VLALTVALLNLPVEMQMGDAAVAMQEVLAFLQAVSTRDPDEGCRAAALGIIQKCAMAGVLDGV
jgi:hypothetical protein